MEADYLQSCKRQFEFYKMLGDKTLMQLPEEKLTWQYNEESNSIATIVKHLHGNMLSRWTDFLTTDGEKESRKRDEEFEQEAISKAALSALWEQGWNCLFNTLNSLKEEDLQQIIYIRNQGHTVVEAINRQLAHYPYHIGQIVFIGKMILNVKWQSLSIPKGKSKTYNQEKFSQEKQKTYFTDEFLTQKKKKMNKTLEFLKARIGKQADESASPLMRWLNPTLLDVDEGKITLRFKVRPEMTNPIGILHGGTTAAIMDDSIGAAVFTYGESFFYSTINLVVDYFGRAALGEEIIAEAFVIKKGKQLIHGQCEIWNTDRTRMLAKGISNLIKTELRKPE